MSMSRTNDRITNGSGGAAILAAVKTGEVWLNLRGVENAHPGLWAEIKHSLSQLAPLVAPRRQPRELRVPRH